LERAASQAHANAVLADDRLRAQGPALVLVGAPSGLPHQQAVDLRTLDRHPWSALTSRIPALWCRSCRPHAPFAELMRLSKTSVADEIHEDDPRQSNGGWEPYTGEG
jgi:hypothetical protein